MSTAARVTALAVALTLVAGACGSDDNGDDASPASTAGDPTTTAAPASTTTVPTNTVPTTTGAPTTSVAPASTIPAVTAPTIDELLAEDVVRNLAHAGGDQDAPHSTPFAFAEAVAAGADVLELDVLLTSDGVLVVQHDDTVDKTTEESGPVADRTLAELQALDNAYWWYEACWPCQDTRDQVPEDEFIYRGVRTGDTEPPAGYTADDFKVPTFREIATRFPDLPLDIEIKGSEDVAPEVAAALAAELQELGRTESVVVVSFSDAVVDTFHELAPDVEVSPGLDRLTAWFLQGTPLEDHFRILQIPPFQSGIALITPPTLERADQEGLTVWGWADDASTQENEAFYREMVELGIGGFIAGRPAAMEAARS
ncbi:MAG: glycerophosphodiester phosphodiesterase family protein [Acidimicrobiales bacterium]